MQRDVPFVKIWNEFRTKPRCAYRTERDQCECAADQQFAVRHRLVEQRRVARVEPGHDPALLLLDLAGDEQRDGGGDEGEREQHGRRQRQNHGNRHRVEGLALDPGERKDRQVNHRDNHDPEQAGAHHFRAGLGDQPEPLLAVEQPPHPVLRFAQPSQTVLDDDNRTIDDQTEIERAETHQIGRHPPLHHAGQRHQHRERNDCGGNQRRADIAEQQEQHDDYQHRTLDQVLFDCADGPVDKFGPIIKRLGNHARRQRRLDLPQPLRRCLRHHARIFPGEHEYCAEHDFLAVLGGCAGAQFRPDHNLGHIADADRHTAASCDDNLG